MAEVAPLKTRRLRHASPTRRKADMVDWPVEQQRYTLLLREGTSGFEPDDSTPQGGLAG